VKKSKIK